MRQTILSISLALLAATSLTGCGTPSESELALSETTYGLMEPWCQMKFQDGSTRLYPDKCVNVVGAGSVSRGVLLAGTCLKLGEPRISYPGLTRTLDYEVKVAGITALISGQDFAIAQGSSGVARRKCTPTQPFVR